MAKGSGGVPSRFSSDFQGADGMLLPYWLRNMFPHVRLQQPARFRARRGFGHDSVLVCHLLHLEARTLLSATSNLLIGGGEYEPAPLESIKTDFDHQQLAAELYAELTTTGTADLLYGMHYELLDDVSTQVTYSSPLINLDAFQTHTSFAGMHGSGYSVVVLDTGIQLNHPHFGPDADGNGVADRIVYQYDFFHGDNNASDFDGHGTHVTGTIASSNTTYAGLAPEVDIILLKVFSDNLDSQPYTSSAVLEQALQWVVANAVEYNIAAVNMSLGGGNHQTAQIAHALRDEFAALAQLNVITVAASGNSFFEFDSNPGVAWPSADPDVISVGSVWTTNFGGPINWGSGATDTTTAADRVVSHSQRHESLTDTLAPGAFIRAAYLNSGVAWLAGTSMATPHVTGAAVLAQQVAMTYLGRRLDVNEFRDLLQTTGVVVNDGDDESDNVNNTGLNFPRLDILALAEAIIGTQTTPTTPTTILAENFDGVTAPTLPTGWTTSDAAGSVTWNTSTTSSFSGINSAFVENKSYVSDVRLTSPAFILGNADNQLSFRNNYHLENTYDGGILEISINGGAFQDILAAGGTFVTGGYTQAIATGWNNPLSGQLAWTGNSNGYTQTRVNLPDAANGQTVQFRWRLGTDVTVSWTGWHIDNVEVTGTVLSSNGLPTAVTLQNAVTEVQDIIRLTTSRKVADIVIVDDDDGDNILSLSGADADLFEIVGSELFIKAGSILNATTNPVLDVTVNVDDPTLGGSPDLTVSHSIAVLPSPLDPEPNNTPAEAIDLGVGSLETMRFGQLHRNTDRIDFYRFTIPDGSVGNLAVTLSELTANAVLRIYQLNGDALGQRVGNSANPDLEDEMLSLSNLAAGDYIIEVAMNKTEAANTTTFYQLEVDIVARVVPVDREPDNLVPEATDLGVASQGNPIDTTLASFLHRNTDRVDLFRFTVAADHSATAQIDLTGLTAETALRLYRINGNELGARVGSSMNPDLEDESISLTGLAAGEYAIEVVMHKTVAGGTQSTYQLSVNVMANGIPSLRVNGTFEQTRPEEPRISRLAVHRLIQAWLRRHIGEVISCPSLPDKTHTIR